MSLHCALNVLRNLHVHSQQQAVLSIALLAAFADGAEDDREREEIRRIADSLAGESGSPQLSALYQDVLLERVDLAKAAAALTDPAHKQLAYEMAVCVCDADGVASPAEQQFLRELREALGLDAGEADKSCVRRTRSQPRRLSRFPRQPLQARCRTPRWTSTS